MYLVSEVFVDIGCKQLFSPGAFHAGNTTLE